MRPAETKSPLGLCSAREGVWMFGVPSIVPQVG